eukprot:TRINITY_DN7679_c0_g1_i1.p1 TRINITY_DN7679_c0_g1~~TRINITY_DN7679_c0_g1_i1.p1  ORF type:complete len:537 (+),score=89.54 TRINITY_DN7679_c0_g1_i1:69-1679(+)
MQKWLLLLTVALCLLTTTGRNVFKSGRTSKDPPCPSFPKPPTCEMDGFHSNSDLQMLFARLASENPDLCEVTSIGKSKKGIDMPVLRITGPELKNDVKPKVKLVGNMHGDEVVGRELIIEFALHIIQNYPTDQRIKNLIDRLEIFLAPTLNPDGFAACTRRNSQAIDMNRDFPDRLRPKETHSKAHETRIIMAWIKSTNFALSGNFHGGEIVVNYPYDAGNKKGGRYSADTDIFRAVSLDYASHNLPMRDTKDFAQGITNGADWYPVYGGMQDWNYEVAGCMEVTLEVSCDKWPAFSTMQAYWEENLESFLSFHEFSLNGVRGRVLDAVTLEPLRANITVDDRPFKVFSGTDGDFTRILLPRAETYEVHVACESYIQQNMTVQLSEEEPGVFVEIFLKKETPPGSPTSSPPTSPSPPPPSPPPTPTPPLPMPTPTPTPTPPSPSTKEPTSPTKPGATVIQSSPVPPPVSPPPPSPFTRPSPPRPTKSLVPLQVPPSFEPGSSIPDPLYISLIVFGVLVLMFYLRRRKGRALVSLSK